MKRRPTILPALFLVAFSASLARADPGKLTWLHEGVCLTYTWYAAVAPGNGSDYQEDEHGQWVNPATGQHYNRSQQHGTSGRGWTQATVACLERGKAVIATQSFGDAGALGKNVPVPLQGGASFVTAADEAPDYWMDPDKLAALHTNPATGLLVTPVTWKVGERDVPAVRVQIISGGNYSLHVIDARTGICLHYATSARGAAPKLVGPGDFRQGNVTLTHGDLIAARDLKISWASQPAPDWLQTLRGLHYRGSYVSRGPLPTVPNEVTIDLVMLNHGQNWAEMSSIAQMQMRGAPAIPPNKTQMAFGRAQFNGLWAAPSVLSSLQVGQVLDEDPVTHMRITVTRMNDTSIVIAQQNAAGEIDSQYERVTGLLTASSFVNVLAQQQTTVRLQGRE